MALRFPARVKATTTTTGTGSYTLTEDGLAGYRTFTRAVTDGDLADGDTVCYIVVDTTVTNGPNLMEIGTGTWNNTTKVLARTTIYQPNGTPQNWGAGTRDVLVIDNPVLFLLLAGGTISGLLKILISGSIITPAAETSLVIQRSATAATEVGLSLISGTTGKSKLNLGDTADEDAGGVYYNNSTNELIFRSNGADGSKMDSSGVLKNSAGAAYLTSVTAAIPAGTVMLFYQAAVPSGWTRVTTVDDKVPIIVSAGSPGTNNTSNWTTSELSCATFALLTTHIPAHTHTISYSLAMGTTGGGSFVDVIGSGAQSGNTGSTGSGTGHAHAVVAGSWRPPGAYCMIASKN